MGEAKKNLKQKLCLLLATITVFCYSPRRAQSETISNDKTQVHR